MLSEKLYLPLLARASEKAVSSSKEILRGILKKMPKSKCLSRLDWETAGQKRLRVALGVPFVYRIYNMKKSQLKKSRYRHQHRVFTWGRNQLIQTGKPRDMGDLIMNIYQVEEVQRKTVILKSALLRLRDNN